MYQVFVYGTLKQGEPNYHVMSGEETGVSKFVGTARLLKKYPLIVSTEFNIPFLLNNPDVGQVTLSLIDLIFVCFSLLKARSMKWMRVNWQH